MNVPEHFQAQYDRMLRKHLHRLTGMDLHIDCTLKYLVRQGIREEARDRKRAIHFTATEVYRFLHIFRSAKASAGKLSELYTVGDAEVLPEDHHVLGGEPTHRETEKTELAGPSIEPEHQVSELLAYFHEVKLLLRGIRPVGTESMEPEYREGI